MFAALSLIAARILIAGLHLPAPLWWFYALGPQLVVCLALGYLTAKRRGGDRLHWLAAAFLAALIPIAGVFVMLWFWWRSPKAPPHTKESATGGSPT